MSLESIPSDVVEGVAPASVPAQAPPVRRASFRWGIWAARLALVAIWLGSWEIAVRAGMDEFLYSRPTLIWKRLVSIFTDGTSQGSIWENMGATLEEAVLGFLLGVLAGVVIGVILGRANFLAEAFSPFIKGANAIPRIVLASLFVIWFGLGLSSKVATAFVLVFFAVFFNSFQGAREVDKNLIDNSRILGASRWQLMRTVVLPSATSWILASMHIAFGLALIGAIVGEFVGADKGLGLLIAHAQGNFDTPAVYAYMLIITVLALVAEWLITKLEHRLTRWRPTASSGAASV